MLRTTLVAVCARALRFGRQPARYASAAPAPAEPPPAAKWLLIDGTNLIYRSFYAMPALGGAERPLGATLGVSNGLLKVALPYALRGANVVFAMDPRGGSQWRKALSPAYKATRPPAPPALLAQLADSAAAARAYGCATVTVAGHEADDVIATLAARHAAEGVDIWTGDKDLLQCCAREGVRVLDARGRAVDARAKFGVDAAKISDYLALVGDASDNVAGVAGVGPKGAAALLAACGDLDGVLAGGAALQAAPKRARDAVARADAAAVRRDRRLVGLDEAVPLPALDCRPFDWDALLAFADDLAFRDFRAKVERTRSRLARSS